jgi:hypothetical protein
MPQIYRNIFPPERIVQGKRGARRQIFFIDSDEGLLYIFSNWKNIRHDPLEMKCDTPEFNSSYPHIKSNVFNGERAFGYFLLFGMGFALIKTYKKEN